MEEAEEGATTASPPPDVENFEAVLRARRSVRGFLPQALPHELIEHVAGLAAGAPSNCNTQPWKVYIVSGEVRARLARDIGAAMRAGRMNPDLPYDGRYAGAYRARQHEAAHALYSAMGVAREDAGARAAAFMRNFDFFGAPHAAFFFLPEGFGLREAADLGMCAQTFMLALTAHGIASCPQTALSFHAELVRAAVGAPAGEVLLFGISFGYEDPAASANAARVGRAPLHETFSFVG